MKLTPALFILGFLWISGMFLLNNRQSDNTTLNAATQAIRDNSLLLQRVSSILTERDSAPVAAPIVQQSSNTEIATTTRMKNLKSEFNL